MVAGLSFGWAAAAGFSGVHCRPALPVAGRGAPGALAAVGAIAALMDFRACVACGLAGRLLGEGVQVEVDKVVVVVDVVESGQEALVGGVEGVDGEDAEAEETDVGDGGAGCLVLWAMRVRVWDQPSGVCTRFSWCLVSVQVPVPWAVSSVVCGGVVEVSWMCGLLTCPGEGSTLGLIPVGMTAGGSGGFQRRHAGCRAYPPL